MEVYLARQPIFDAHYRTAGYELLYRDAANLNQAQFTDGDTATCRLLSDAMTVFGLPKLTNAKPAYVNFTDTLLLNDFVSLAKPKEIVVELLENIRITDGLVKKLGELRRAGYRLALDDYTGSEYFQCLLPMVSIVKVDFRATSQRQQREIAWDLKKYRRMALLAEKVETQEEFEWAAKLGYRLFQGYFFEKPVTLHKQRGFQVRTSYVRLLRELNRPGGADLGICAQVIRSDAALTYEIIRQVQKLYYYRGNLITDITLALVVMGVDEVRRWALLVMARDNNVTCSDELLRRSYLRGAFAKRLMRRCAKREDPENGFLLGMFSMLDQVMGMDMETLLAEVELPRPITKALLGKADSIYSRLLEYIIIYETGDRDLELPDIGVSISDREASQLYMDSLLETDRAFTNILGK